MFRMSPLTGKSFRRFFQASKRPYRRQQSRHLRLILERLEDRTLLSSSPSNITGRVLETGEWWTGVSNGSSAFNNSLWASWNAHVTWVDVVTGDFNGDGQTDVAARVLQTGEIWVALSNGSGFTTTRWTTWNPNVTWADVKVGDFTGDGKDDLVGRVAQTGEIWVATSTGSSFTNSLWTKWSSNTQWVDTQVGDFTGDGKAGYAARDRVTGAWWTGVSTGSSFTTSLWTIWNNQVTWLDVRVGDFNGDGKADIVGRVKETGEWWVGLSNGASFIASLWASWSTAVTWSDVQVGDFNGDGKADITGRASQLLAVSTVGGTNGESATAASGDQSNCGQGDGEGDNSCQDGSAAGQAQADISNQESQNQPLAQWWTGLSTGSSFTTTLWGTWNPNVTWTDVKVGDFNGDGKDDVVGRVKETGEWWMGVSTGSSFAPSLWTRWNPNVTWVDVLTLGLHNTKPVIAIVGPSGTATNHNVTITGQVAGGGSAIASLSVAVDGGAFSSLAFDSSGHFSFTTSFALDGSADGNHVVHFLATNSNGNTSDPVAFPFILDTRPPQVSITGPTGIVNTNNNVTVTGQATDSLSGVTSLQAAVDSGPFAPVTFDSSGKFSFTTGLTLDGTADGGHHALFRATDKAGNTFDAPFSFTLLTKPPAAPMFNLDPTANTGTAANPATTAGIVTLIGHTDPNVSVILTGTGLQTLSNNTGTFQFPDVSLNVGANTFTTQASDAAGASSFTLSITRLPPPNQENQVLVWNQAVLNAIHQDASDPLVASRAMAMVQAAVFDAISAIQGTPGYAVQLTAPTDASPDAAVAAAAHTVLSYLYPAEQATFDALLNNSLASIPDGQGKTDGVSSGQVAGNAIIALRANDGWNKFVDYVPGTGPGVWVPTPPMFMETLSPQWATMQPWVMTADNQFRPAGPPALGSQAWTDAFNEVKSLGSATSTIRTADQTQIARFWADGSGSYTPPGHWNQIAEQAAQQSGDSLAEDARLFAELDITLADAAIAAWDTKYAYAGWRPITAIRAADTAGNPNITSDPNWTPLLITPNFPEYISGHSTFSAAAATVLDNFFGTSYSFSSSSATLPGVTRSFTGFDQAAAEAGQSRIYAGIHFQFSNQDGQATGRALANYALSFFNIAQDTIPPQIALNSVLPSGATNHNFTLAGQVTDNLSGVASLTLQVDQGSVRSLAFDPSGSFSVPTNFALDGSGDGPHTLTLVAKDFAGNVSAPVQFSFMLSTRPPVITITSPVNGSNIAAGAPLTGTVAGSHNTPITALSYAFDGGASMPLVFDAAGNFSQGLDLSKLTAGSHTLTVSTQDAAGNLAATTLNLNLPGLIPFTITSVTPTAGADQVGVTFRPKVVFSRPVDPTTLNSSDFFATDTTGAKLPATIVPSDDGTFAWLFFTNPMPGASTITLTINGSQIKTPDGALLDAARNGTPGSLWTSTFTTVNEAAVPGTTLSGTLADPGPDLKPGTFDDVRPGPDGVLDTADDVYLRPIQGAKVFILGQENQAVFTDAQGRFSFSSVPTGDVKLALEGNTSGVTVYDPAQQQFVDPHSEGFYFPEMVMDLTIKPGVANTVMGSMGTLQQETANATNLGVYLPRVQTSILQTLSATQPTTVGLTGGSAPDLTPQQQQELTMTVQPNTAIGLDGQKMSNVQVGVSTVPPQLVMDMLPKGVLQHTFDITIQAPGVATFTTPAQLTFPNVFNAAPGTQLDFLSFDHTTGRLVIEGTATVSADGLSVKTDPGMGITHPGWHGLTPPGNCGGPGGPPIGHPTAGMPQVTNHDPVPLLLITGDNSPSTFLTQTWTAPANLNPPPGTCGVPQHSTDPKQPFKLVSIDIDGPLFAFMKPVPGGRPLVPHQTFALLAGTGKTETFGLQTKTYNELFGAGNFKSLTRDQLYGAQIKIKVFEQKADGTQTEDNYTWYQYRWVDVVDAEKAMTKSGVTAAFLKTLAGDSIYGKVFTRTKNVAVHLPSSNEPTTFSGPILGSDFDLGAPVFGEATDVWKFQPTVSGDKFVDFDIRVTDPKAGDLTVGTIVATGTGINKKTISINESGYEAELERVIKALKRVWVPGPDGVPGRAGIDSNGDRVPNDIHEYGAPGSDDSQQIVYDPFPNAPNPSNSLTTTTLSSQGGAVADVVDPAAAAFIREINIRAPSGPGFIAGPRFLRDFAAFLPGQNYTQAQLDARAQQEGDALFAQVQADFQPLIAAGAVDVVKSNFLADVQMDWHDDFDNGTPSYGHTNGGLDYPLDRFRQFLGTQGRVDPVTGNAYSLDISDAAQTWVLADGLNQHVHNTGAFAVGINISWTDPNTDFAQFVANTVDHELGHTFGLNEAYITPVPANAPGTAMCNAQGNCYPYDIMRLGLNSDPKLSFAPPTVELLKAAMGVEDNVDLPISNGLKMFRDNFNLRPSPGSVNGLRASAGNVPSTPEIEVSRNAGLFFGGETDTYDTAAANQSVMVAYTVTNFGTAPLTLAGVALANGHNFSLQPDALALTGQTLAPNQSATFHILFQPSTAGDFQESLTITSNAGMEPTFHLNLDGPAISQQPVARLTINRNNNLGGMAVNGGQPAVVSDLATITNDGAQPLTISSILVEGGSSSFTLTGVPANLAANPISLATGQSFTFGVQYTAGTVGLERAKIGISTNDPSQPVLHFGVVGTGLDKVVYPHWARDYVAIEFPNLPGGSVLRAVSDDSGNFSFFLPPQQAYHLAIFDPITGLIAHGYGVTPPSGQGIDLTANLVFGPSTAKDTGGDGLPDDVEFAIGLSPKGSQVSADGIDYFTHVIIDHTDPLATTPVITGVLASLALQGEATAVALQGSPTNAQGQTAYVATGSYGLAIVNATQFQTPVLLGQIQLAGTSTDVAVDPNLQIAAVASNGGGLNLVDVSNPMQPKLLKTISVNTPAVRVVDGVAYAAVGTGLQAYDLFTGTLLQTLDLAGGSITSMARDGSFLYTLDSANTLRVIDISAPQMAARGSVNVAPGATLSSGSGALFVGGGIAYIGVTLYDSIGSNGFVTLASGYTTVDVTNPDNLLATGALPPTSAAGQAITVNGSGIALTVGKDANGPAGSVFGSSNPNNVTQFLTRFSLPVAALGVAIGEGIGFVADGTAGLQVINYLAFDSAGVAPTASISTPVGSQAIQGSTIPIVASVSDDVQVRNVELLVNGQVIRNDVSFPYDLSVNLPTIAQNGSNTVTIQVEAIDTGGNSSLSNPLVVQLLRDTTPPTIQSINPADGTAEDSGRQLIQVLFSKPLATATVTTSTFKLLDGAGNSVPPLDLRLHEDDQLAQLSYDPLPPGHYQLGIDAAAITDRAGNPLGAARIRSRFTELFIVTGSATITTVAGNGTSGHYSGDGGPAILAALNEPSAVAVGPDGSLYIADSINSVIRRVGLDGVITSVAGNGFYGYGGDGGLATQAELQFPSGVALGPDGSLYIADTGNGRIRRVGPDGIITTVAAGIGHYGPEPQGVALGPDGSLYIADSANSVIRRVGPDGIITTVAGNGTQGYGGDGLPATQAELYDPSGIALGPDGSIYIADYGNQRIRRVRPDGVITTVAGNGTNGGGDGGAATQAGFVPFGVAFSPDGSFYIADLSNRIRRVGPDGIITTVAGNGTRGYSGDGGPAAQAEVAYPSGVALDPNGRLYIVDTGNGRIRRVGPSLPIPLTILSIKPADGTTEIKGLQLVQVIFSKPLAAATVTTNTFQLLDGAGNPVAPLSIQLQNDDQLVELSYDPLPLGHYQLVIDAAAVTDLAGNVLAAAPVRSHFTLVPPPVTGNDTITTVAGNGTLGYSGDGGPATQASLFAGRIAVGPDGSLYIADYGKNHIRRVGPDGIITTVAGNGFYGYTGDGGPATQASLAVPDGVAVGPDGSLYIADTGNNRIRRVGPDGIITTVAGNGTAGYSGDGGPATKASINITSSGSGVGIAVGPDGSLYIADASLSNRVRRVGPDGIITTVAGNGTCCNNFGDGGLATQASLVPYGIAIGPDGSLYIADALNSLIRRVLPNGIITTVAGNGAEGYSGDGGPATQASFNNPVDIAVGLDGSLYIADLGNKRIRRVGPDGIITTVVGNGRFGYTGDGGPAIQAALEDPEGVALGPDGSLYIAITVDHRVRRVGP